MILAPDACLSDTARHARPQGTEMAEDPVRLSPECVKSGRTESVHPAPPHWLGLAGSPGRSPKLATVGSTPTSSSHTAPRSSVVVDSPWLANLNVRTLDTCVTRSAERVFLEFPDCVLLDIRRSAPVSVFLIPSANHLIAQRAGHQCRKTMPVYQFSQVAQHSWTPETLTPANSAALWITIRSPVVCMCADGRR